MPLRGKRVLDACALSGFTSFAMEALGAEVVSYDRAEGRHWDLVPFCDGAPPSHLVPLLDAHQARIAPRLPPLPRGARLPAERVEGDLCAIPEAIARSTSLWSGRWRMSATVPGAARHAAPRPGDRPGHRTLPRRRWFDPGGSSRNAGPGGTARAVLARAPGGPALGRPLAFLPRSGQGNPFAAWWQIPPRTIVRWLHVIGFCETRIAYHRRPLAGRMRTLYAVVGRRTQANHAAL